MILIADKDSDSLTLLRSRLEARSYSVLTCESSQSALRLVKENPLDLVLLASEMETINGNDLAITIKESTLNYFLPIIMMTERDHIAKQIVGIHHGYDDFIIKPFSSLEIQLRIEMVLKKSFECIQANPLTHLPGNNTIENIINKRIANKSVFSVCYIDIDNFKAFNDKYGFDKGDDVIVQTARILKQAAHEYTDKDVFVGHVGGDDFIIVCSPEIEEKIAMKVIKEFDRLIPTHYSAEDREEGSITVTNRRGRKEKFAIASISIAAVTNATHAYRNTGEIAQVAAEVKKYLKTQSGSNYLRDRREQPIESIMDATRILNRDEVVETTSEPLGQILVKAGLITEEQLQEALKKHFTTGQRLGRILITMKAISSEKVGEMLEQKLGVPYVCLKSISVISKVKRLFTEEYIRMHGVIPFHLEEGVLSVAMIDPFDLNTIDDIERITGYKVAPHISLEEEFTEFIEENLSHEK
jgi:diguanylate cyclase (GGDEF)-like protein